MDKSKKRAYEIIETYIEKAKDLEFVDSIYLVGSLSYDEYTKVFLTKQDTWLSDYEDMRNE
ncbi:MAG: hypothetical protein IJV29_04080 [Butyrivibrio sp.]|nr:hypothetical protein [Butyrivibrio sp.]